MAGQTFTKAIGHDGVVRAVVRITIAVIGNYAFTLGASSLFAVVLVLGGCARAEAAAFASMIGFLLYLVVLIYAVHTPHVMRLCLTMTVATAVSLALAHWLARGLA